MNNRDVAVIGAGIIGISCALRLQEAGWQVTLMDRAAPGLGASFGNAGLIGPNAIVPTALPGILPKLPGWILDPNGPVAVDPVRLLLSARWFIRWAMASRLGAALENAMALDHLNRDVIEGYRGLLGDDEFSRQIAPEPSVTVWRDRPTGKAVQAREQIYAGSGIDAHELTDGALWDFVPSLSRDYCYGLVVAGSAFVRSPHRLAMSLFGRFIERGGRFENRTVNGFVTQDNRVAAIRTDGGEVATSHLVLATGAESAGLARQLGQAALIEAENGYHIMLDAPPDLLARPILDATNKVAISPMADGLRVTGFAEFRGAGARPLARRQAQLAAFARQVVPALPGEPVSFWMGARPSTPSSVPVIGRSRRYANAVFASGHGHYGMSGAPGTAARVLEIFSAP